MRHRRPLHPRRFVPLAIVAALVAVPAVADTGVPGLSGAPNVDPPPPPINVPAPPVDVPATVSQVQAAAQSTVDQAAQTATQVQQAVTPTRQQPPAHSGTAAPATAPAAAPRQRSVASVVRRSSRQVRQAPAPVHRASARSAADGVRPARTSHAASPHHGQARRHVTHFAPRPIARPLPAAVLRNLSAQPPAAAVPLPASHRRAHHAGRTFPHFGMPPAPSAPMLLLILAVIGVAMVRPPPSCRPACATRRWPGPGAGCAADA